MRFFGYFSFGLGFLFLASISVVGCRKAGPKGVSGVVSGKVSYKSSPVTGGVIKFHGRDGKVSHVGAVKADGSFSFSGVPVGDWTVCIDTKSGDFPENLDPAKMGSMPPEAKKQFEESKKLALKGVAAEKRVVIPDKYADPKTSGLTWSIKEGDQGKDFSLVD